MAIRFALSAIRHGVDSARARYVIEHCPDPIYPSPSESGESDRLLFLGPDQRGIPLEVLAIELPEDDLLVIHVMRLRAKYLDEYERVMEWQRRS